MFSLFKKKPTSVDGVIKAFSQMVDDLKVVEQHNNEASAEQTRIAQEAEQKAAEHKQEAQRAGVVRSKIEAITQA